MHACRRVASSSRRILEVSKFRPICSAPVRLQAITGQRQQPFSTVPEQTQASSKLETSSDNSSSPTKETLLRIDWMLEHMLPGLMKSRLVPFFDLVQDDVQFEDKLYNYKLGKKSQLLTHIAKIRLYFRYRSPYNKVEYVGSCVYENDDVVVLLWRLRYLESSFWTYFPSFLTKKEPKLNTLEGALDVHITKDGYIYKIVNRKVTTADLEGSKVMAEMKKESSEALMKEEEKQWRKQIQEEFDRERAGLP